MNDRAGPLVSVEGFDEQPTLEAVAKSLGVPQDNIDANFGVVLIDPRSGTYCVQLKADAPLDSISEENGPWANPPIGPIG